MKKAELKREDMKLSRSASPVQLPARGGGWPSDRRLYAYIDEMEVPADFVTTGETRETYLQLMEASLSGYGLELADASWGRDGEGRPQDMQAYSRIVCVLGGLIGAGRRAELQPLWEQMMEAACRQLPRMTGDQMADFATKELLLAYKAMKLHVDAGQLRAWADLLATVDPEVNYVHTRTAVPDTDRLHNINLYNMAGEYLRQTEGMTDADSYLDAHWPLQLGRFDDNGMYRDPGCPLLYDLAARCHIQLMLAYSYEGPYAEELDRHLEAGGMMTLFLQSAAGHIPYGGRSSQFQFNEALAAACAEYEASRHQRAGRVKLAGAFKRSARLSAQAVRRWVLEMTPPRHVKNGYAIGSGYGAEPYAYYDKYMVTLGSFAYMAYLFADDAIAEQPCPAEAGGYVLATSPAFHQIVASAGGQSIQLDTAADGRYDATGLGRYHRRGMPAELGLSSPLSGAPGYLLPHGVAARAAAIGPGWERPDGTVAYLAEQAAGLEHRLTVHAEEADRVVFSLVYSGGELPDGHTLRETYALSPEGLDIEAVLELEERVADGDRAGELRAGEGMLLHDAMAAEQGTAGAPGPGDLRGAQPGTDAGTARTDLSPIRYRVPLFCDNGAEESGLAIKCNGDDVQATVILGDDRYSLSTTGRLDIEEERCGNRNGEYRLAVIRSDERAIRVRLTLWRAETAADRKT
ncbi:hypothetical protein PA598K_00785 [Paenibacillus sp. 598K]|uniref:hypothetical protein n=1 Tax=Paenibacillus sp. 598K TaxID=1117987 RepID=UPI000FF914D7|nr:hypothetical protein [Paenibacillus sp. 598K]GBF72529.1 hypothetical protein PA598K_00785 [Paenibacillus sp. 598K]